MEKITKTLIQPNLNNTATWKTETKREVTCDICGGDALYRNKDYYGEEYAVDEFLTIDETWGFFSPWDGERWSCHVCISCVKEKIMPMMKINWKSYFGDSSEGYYHGGKSFMRTSPDEEFKEVI